MAKDIQSGFTLIELSIVLVIIGLLAGGVLVGRDLIRASEIRATVSQIEKYKTAINTFKLKYVCLPGDCAEVANFGLGTNPGNGNGVIDICTGCNGGVGSSEPDYFWEHLKVANLIGEGLIDYALIQAPLAKAPGSIFLIYYLQTGIPAQNADGHAYFSISKDTFNACGGAVMDCPSLAPEFAYGIDVKIDDGLPKSGTITGTGGWSTYAAGGIPSEGTAASNVCINTDVTPAVYNTQNRALLCGLFIRFM